MDLMKSRPQPVGLFRIVPLALLLALPGAVAAQPTDAAVDIAVGVGLTVGPSESCHENGLVVDNCDPVWKAWSGSLAWYLTDRTAVVGEVRGAYVSPGHHGKEGRFFDTLRMGDSGAYTFSAGMRRYLRSGRRRVAPFADVLAGYGRLVSGLPRRPSSLEGL